MAHADWVNTVPVPYWSKANISAVLCKGDTKMYTVKLNFSN